MGKAGFMNIMIVCIIAAVMAQSVNAQTVHVVGGTTGWVVPSNNDVYDNWADTQVFRVGDILTFNFVTNAHDVVEVTEVSYDACTSTNIIGSIINTGPANITLTTAGEHWYICTFRSGGHCQGGQKLDITVLAATPGTAAPPPPPTTTNTTTPPPPANGPTTSTSPPPPTATTTSPPPPDSSSPIVLGSVIVSFVSIAFGLLF